MAINRVPHRVTEETEVEAEAAILAQFERLDYVYEHMAPVWHAIEAELRQSLR